MSHRGRILVVDDEKIATRNLEHVFKKEGYQVATANSGAKAIALFEHEPFDVVLTDLKMEKVDGLQVLRRCRELRPDVEVIVITGFATLASAVETVKSGAFQYVAKPFQLDDLRTIVAEAMEKVRTRREIAVLRESDGAKGQVVIVTRDSGMMHLLELARQVAPTDCTVLITGESGTGKELFARYLHQHSNRGTWPFLAVNCGALNEDLLTNELFGHERGAYTGATSEKKGLIEVASGGTLFLDEVTEMSPAMQVKLLRVVQEREVMRVGGTKSVKVDVRLIAATNRNLVEAVSSGRFRQDLYFRLNVVNIDVPPLVQRHGDVPLLASYFLQQFNDLMHKRVTEITPEAMALLDGYAYPGNVRELRNAIERAVAICQGTIIEPATLPDALRNTHRRTFASPSKNSSLISLEEQEKEYINWVMDQVSGNQTLAARILGINRVSLWRKLKRYDQPEVDKPQEAQ
ncbi:MAG: sigma-54 dependent transcriptional regulator [Alphaproteobacteria bacterium]